MRAGRLFALMLTGVACAAAEDYGPRVDQILKQHRGHWGISIRHAATGQPLFERCADCFFLPASTAKLFSTSFAWLHLGPQHHFRTRVVWEDDGSLRLIGGGDPTLSRRPYPYAKGAPWFARVAALDELAAKVAAGAREVREVIGDDTLWPWEPSPEGWSHDDFVWDYGAPVSALSVNENTLHLTILPGKAVGDPARLKWTPDLEYFTVDNRVETVAAGARELRVVRMPGSRQLLLTGRLPLRDRGWANDLAVEDPALLAALAFKQSLERAGVRVTGEARARHRAPGTPAAAPQALKVAAERVSPPLWQILQVVNKVSHNLLAEMALRASGGPAALRAFLPSLGVAQTEFKLEDGSGLSRLDLVTPNALTRLLTAMNKYEDFALTLPVGGLDGSLDRRYAGFAGASRIRAKTGGLTGVQTIAGYIDSPTHGKLAFAILMNNDVNGGASARAVMDEITLLFAR